jgi:hypothetical protein
LAQELGSIISNAPKNEAAKTNKTKKNDIKPHIGRQGISISTKNPGHHKSKTLNYNNRNSINSISNTFSPTFTLFSKKSYRHRNHWENKVLIVPQIRQECDKKIDHNPFWNRPLFF